MVWCGVVCVVWCGPGVGPLGVVPPCVLGLLWVFSILIPMMILMMMMMMNSNTLVFSLVGRPVSSAHVPGNDYRFIDRRLTIFVTVVALGAIAIRLQWASCHRDHACQGTRSS